MTTIERSTTVSASKLAVALSATALLVSVLLATPVGQAAGRLVLAKNSVGAAQLKKNAVTSAKVRNGSLLAADFKAGQLPAGPQGAKGDKGDPGAPGASLLRPPVQCDPDDRLGLELVQPDLPGPSVRADRRLLREPGG
jgi:hypothetical protein